MFVQNKYYDCYYNIINRAKSRKLNDYTETHHIIPKSLGGNNDRNNLVELTAKEHFICHLLLTKITTGKNKRSMIFALNALSNLNNSFQSRYQSRTYEKYRKMFALQQSEEMSGYKNPMFGIKHKEESRIKMSIANKGKTAWNKGKTLSIEHKTKISESNRGSKNFMFGKSHSIDVKNKISEKNKGHSHNKGILKTEEHKQKLSSSLKGILKTEEHKEKLKNIPKIKCNKCGKLTSPAMNKRWHNENCKVNS